MAQNDARYGYLEINGRPMTDEKLARAVGVSDAECSALIAELGAAGVFSRDAETIYSRRLVRDGELRDAGKKTGGLNKSKEEAISHKSIATRQSGPKGGPALYPKGGPEGAGAPLRFQPQFDELQASHPDLRTLKYDVLQNLARLHGDENVAALVSEIALEARSLPDNITNPAAWIRGRAQTLTSAPAGKKPVVVVTPKLTAADYKAASEERFRQKQIAMVRSDG